MPEFTTAAARTVAEALSAEVPIAPLVAKAGLRCELTPFAGVLPERGDTLLTVLYGVDDVVAAELTAAARVSLAVPNRILGGPPQVEHWRSRRAVHSFKRGALAWSEDGERLAGCLASDAGADPATAAREHFRALLGLLEERGYPYFLRVWNYLPRINELERGHERYRLFNSGRASAFAGLRLAGGASGADAARLFPASSAVGTPGSRLLTAFLAVNAPPRHLENPRQTAAWRYPPRYGPVPPTFSRATVAGGSWMLSGTASIVGHASRHAGSLLGQLDETLRNIEQVIATARDMPEGGCRVASLADFDLVKVYLREAGDLEAVRTALAPRLRPGTPTLFLEADICRRELRLEIEGFALGGAIAR